MLTDEQAEQVKKQLLDQLGNFPQEQQESMKSEIEAMDNEQLEEFLVKNNLVKPGENQKPQQSPFRSIINGDIPSYKIDENKVAIAVLEINPISKGHVIVIPKEPTDPSKLPTQAFTLANKIAKKLKSKLKPKTTNINTMEVFGEGIINVVPIYEGDDPSKERTKADDAELKDLQEKLKTKPRTKRISESGIEIKPRKKSESKSKLPKAPVRIP